jgi:pimeloyl-ACP methyl ester carboxylesterase
MPWFAPRRTARCPVEATVGPSTTEQERTMNRSITAVSATPRERSTLAERGAPTLAMQVQRCGRTAALADVLYVHGATFGADLSLYFAFDPFSWADALCAAGFDAWGFDFAGYGDSQRYPDDVEGMPCDIDDAAAQLRRVIAAVRARNGGRPVVLLGHSHGGTVAARHAALHGDDLRALLLFAPAVTRDAGRAPATPTQPHHVLTVWAQYRRFIEDVPRGHPPVLSDAHYDAWSAAFLRSDSAAASRTPPSVRTPAGPLADIAALWNGQSLFDAARIAVPTLLVRGQWDSVCDDADAQRLLAALGTADKVDVRIERATHLMHLERQRGALHEAVNRFLLARCG